MMYGDTSRIGIPFSKDPHVVEFQGKYLMYYSIPPKQNGNAEAQGWGIGIAREQESERLASYWRNHTSNSL